MNIADTSNNGTVIEPLNSANSPSSDLAGCPFYSVVHDENMAVTNLPLLNPSAEQQCEPVVNTQKDWVAEPDSEKQAVVDSEFHKLLTLNQELSTANDDLYSQVEQLKHELTEAEKILQWQKKRSSVTDSMLNQQTQELSAAQEQIESLFQQLETAVQTVQSQEIFIETHKAHLQISQQRLAQLERQCSLLQTNYSEQSQQLLHSENTCRELRTRLMRQQRQTLQFKAALEKCLETSVPNHDTLEDKAHHPHDVTGGHTRFSRKARSLFPNAQPIKPWSAESDFVSDTCGSLHQHVEHQHADSSWVEPLTPCSHEKNYSAPIPVSSENWSDDECTFTSTEIAASLEDNESVITSEAASNSNSSNIDQQLESLIQMFFTSAPTSAIPLTTAENEQSDQADTPISETLAFIIENAEKLKITTEQDLKTDIISPPATYSAGVDNSLISASNDPSIIPTSPHEETNAVEIEDYWSDVSPSTTSKLPRHHFSPEPLGEYPQDHKSPSPLIYPQRPPKGRKSLASVELPNFRTKGNESKVNDEE
ncbi:hypothetical protein H6G54_27500 [Anabaena cylindrica FACHB-243]|uniref:Uncharacterized protein n=1 Tax=Anabaena cylindrica (strain ATCC 27899 / PCC 7122) TaxID=272123 RepID=K9Z9R4_ANACC|nr:MULTISPECIES: hypothetical protein [Anabaena]AFZ55938.1 hypothetical protein Anacy_0336 [Anabaena cylindrica PCC 7122]MBD2421359.1 hypothetical protein [Anabaena cylindrica FACHB-243]MCM2406691.1 hypothetical protein [Anabaena sp. CCAP 1446/1C]BAY01635.1 hypothetical protein NIES19_08710 [Anabaena cylindrica PCC 7122]